MNAHIGRFVGLAGLVFLLSFRASAGAPAGRYTASGGTVYDGMTKLTWQQTPPSTTYTWASAKTYCASVGTTLRGSGWRLPTIKELLTLTDFSYSVMGSAFDPVAFPSPQPALYWSASRSAFASSSAWVAGFSSGGSDPTAVDASKPCSVRCVR
jgi:hypothetical protein